MGALLTLADTDYLKRNTATYNDAQGTMMAWVNVPSVVASQTVISSANNGSNDRYIYLRISAGGKIRLTQNNADAVTAIDTTNVIPINTWRHVAIVSLAGVYHMYLHGVEETNVTAGANNGDWFLQTTLRDNFIIGMLQRLAIGTIFGGTIFDPRIYNVGLTQPEIQSIVYGEGSDNITRGLVGRWPMLERPTGTVIDATMVKDISGSGFDMDGVVGGTPEYIDTPHRIIQPMSFVPHIDTAALTAQQVINNTEFGFGFGPYIS